MRDVRPEFVVRLTGLVASRGDNVNPKLPTGQVEVRATGLEILSRSRPVPFPMEDEVDALETTRLTYRYLDLRRPALQRIMALRARTAKLVRDELTAQAHRRLNEHEARAGLPFVVGRDNRSRGLSIGRRGRNLPEMLALQLDGAATWHDVLRLVRVHETP